MKIILFIVLAVSSYSLFQAFLPPYGDSREAFSQNQRLTATVNISGNTFPITFDAGLTVTEAMHRAGFQSTENDQTYPALDAQLLPGTSIVWQPVRSVRILADGADKTVSAILQRAR